MQNIEKLQQLKQLLDEGIISTEEFEIRKKQILFPEIIEEEKRKAEEEKQRLAEEERKNEVFEAAIKKFNNKTSDSFKQGISELESLEKWRDADSLVEQYKQELAEIEKIEEDKRLELERKDIYEKANQKFRVNTSQSFRAGINELSKLGDWRDAAEIVEQRKSELKEIEAKENLEKEKKKKKWKKIITIAAVAAAVIIALVILFAVVLKPDLSNYSSMEDYKINSMSYKVPEDWQTEGMSTNKMAKYTLSKNNKVIALLVVEYLGDTDLEGAAGYNKDSKKSKSDTVAKKIIPDTSGRFDTVVADNSMYDVSLYCDEKKVKGAAELLNTVKESFDVKGYKNPRTYEGIKAYYSGDTSAGVTIDADSEGLSVRESYKTAIGLGTKDASFTVEEPVTLEAGETSTLVIESGDNKTELNITCSDKGAFYEDGSFTASLDEIMTEYKKNYSSVRAYSGSTVAGGDIAIQLKDYTYGGQFNCNTTNHSYIVTFTGTESSGDGFKASSEVPGNLVVMIQTEGKVESEDLLCIISIFGNMLADLNPDIDQTDAHNEILDAMQSASGDTVAAIDRTYEGINYTIAYTPGLYTLEIKG